MSTELVEFHARQPADRRPALAARRAAFHHAGGHDATVQVVRRRPGDRGDHRPARAPQRRGPATAAALLRGLRGLRRRTTAVGGRPHRGAAAPSAPGPTSRRWPRATAARCPTTGPGRWARPAWSCPSRSSPPSRASPWPAASSWPCGATCGWRPPTPSSACSAGASACRCSTGHRPAAPAHRPGPGPRPHPDRPRGRGHEALAMGLVNRVVPERRGPGARRVAWAHQLAALPQICLRNDRLSALAQWGQPVADAMARELRLGLDSLASPEPLAGARGSPPGPGATARCVDPAGRLTGRAGRRDGGRRRLRLRRHADRRRERLRLPVGAGRAAGRVAAVRWPWPRSWPSPPWPAAAGPTRPRSGCSSGSWPAWPGRTPRGGGRPLRTGPPGPAPAGPTSADRLEWHRRRGDRVVIVSASPERLRRGRPADQLGADGVIATRLEVRRRHRSPGATRAPTAGGRRSPPPAALDRESGTAPDRLWAYGNSRGDLTHAAGRRRGRQRRPARPDGRPAGLPGPRTATGPDPAAGRRPEMGARRPPRPRVQRYSFRRIHTRTNQPQIGGR